MVIQKILSSPFTPWDEHALKFIVLYRFRMVYGFAKLLQRVWARQAYFNFTIWKFSCENFECLQTRVQAYTFRVKLAYTRYYFANIAL